MIGIIETNMNDQHLFWCEEFVKPKSFNTKEALKEAILKKAKACTKRKKKLNIYSFDHGLKFLYYMGVESGVNVRAYRRFIAEYKTEDINMSFSDINNIFSKESCEGLSCWDSIYKQIELLKNLKSYMKEEQIKTKRIITIGQVAKDYILGELSKTNEGRILFENIPFRKLKDCMYNEKILESYRGGRCEMFQNGGHKNVTHIDVNSLYPYSACTMPFPNLDTEKFTKKPLQTMYLYEFLEKIGVARATLVNEYCDIGVLPVRYKDKTIYPTQNKTITGTWTIAEIEQAYWNGYVILDVEWCVTFEKQKNPFSSIMTKLYHQKNITEGSKKRFYKDLMNHSFGKFAQKNTKTIISFRHWKEQEELEKDGYTIIDSLNETIVAEKEIVEERKKYFCPIIPTFINAYSRIYLNSMLLRIPKDDLLYTDTDSIIFKGNHLNKFPLSDKLGHFKIEHQNTEYFGFCPKTYSIAEEHKISGVNLKESKQKDLKEGIIDYDIKKGIKDIEHAGEIQQRHRNLLKDMIKYDDFMSDIDLIDEFEE